MGVGSGTMRLRCEAAMAALVYVQYHSKNIELDVERDEDLRIQGGSKRANVMRSYTCQLGG